MISRLQSIFLDAWWGGGLGIAAGDWGWEWKWERLNGTMKPGVAEWKGLWDKDVYHKLSQEIKICEQKKKNWRHKKSLQFLEINTEFGIKKQLARVGSRLIAAWKQWRKAKLLSTHTPPGGEDAKWLDRLLFGGPEREKKGFEIWLFFSDLSRTDMAKCPMIRPQTPHKEKNKSNQKKEAILHIGIQV